MQLRRSRAGSSSLLGFAGFSGSVQRQPRSCRAPQQPTHGESHKTQSSDPTRQGAPRAGRAALVGAGA
jgi:hypothetical protein